MAQLPTWARPPQTLYFVVYGIANSKVGMIRVSYDGYVTMEFADAAGGVDYRTTVKYNVN